MKSMSEQLQQIKQQMATSAPVKADRTTSAHKVQNGQKGSPEKMTAWQRAQQAKKAEAPRQRKTAPAAVNTIEGTKSGKPLPPGEKRKNRQKKINDKKLKRLISHWPELFCLDNPRPIAIGIHDMIVTDIDARQLPGKGGILHALHRYTHHYKYIQAIVAGGLRYDLNGSPCGEVTPEQQKHAAERLEAMKAEREEKNAGNAQQ